MYQKTINKRSTKLPEENVEYTFIFPKNKLVKFIYCGLNDKGRLILMNTQTKTFTNMSIGWFNALCGKRHQLVSKKSLTNKQEPQKQNFTLKWKKETYEERTLRELRSLSPATALSVELAIGYPAAKLADELQSILLDKDEEKYSNEYVNRVFRNLNKAENIYKYNNKAFSL